MATEFSRVELISVFGQYRSTGWEIGLILWLLSVAVIIAFFSRRAWASRLACLALTAVWAWAAVAYHPALFAAANPAAWAFSTMFLGETVVLGWQGLIRERLRFEAGTSVWHLLGFCFIAYALVYPIVGSLDGDHWPRLATSAIPSLATVLTAGVMLCVVRPLPKASWMIPVLWCVLGGAAAVVLGLGGAWALAAAGGALLLRGLAQPPLAARSTLFAPDAGEPILLALQLFAISLANSEVESQHKYE